MNIYLIDLQNNTTPGPLMSKNKPEIHNGTVSHLLNLPRELRDHIYTFLLNEQHQPPEDPSQTGDRNANSSTTYFQLPSPKPALLQLKLCSKQLYAEVSDTITKNINPEPKPAHLDIMVKGSSLYPTWLHLPLTPHLHPTVNITLRLFESAGWGSEFNTGAYRGLWSLFCALVYSGPCFDHNARGLSSPLEFGRLRFDIRLCFPTSVDDLFGTYRDVFDRLERLAMDNVGLGHVEVVEACFGVDCRAWKLRQLPTGLTFASRV
jgi:hypothetical protein